ncbi:hypothetical protein ACE14D_10865, partial [Streptomyces sp. Act-28]
AEVDRLAAARDEARERAAAAREEYERLRAEVDGLDADDAGLAAVTRASSGTADPPDETMPRAPSRNPGSGTRSACQA